MDPFKSPWPKDLVAPRRTLGEALSNIAEAELDEKVDIALESVDNGFETYVVITVKTREWEESKPLTKPEKGVIESPANEAQLASLMEADLRELCGRIKAKCE